MTSRKPPTAPNLPTFRFRDQAESRREVLRAAAGTVGAVLVVDLAPLCDLAEKVCAAADGFFGLDPESKARAAGPADSVPGPDYDPGRGDRATGPGRGWNGYLDAAGRPSFERLGIARFDDARQAAAAGVRPGHLDLYEPATMWPDGPLRDLVDRFRTASAIVCEDLLRETAKAAGFAPNTFVADGPDHTDVALTRYHPREEPTPGEHDGFGYSPRRDSTFVSLFAGTGERGCLQVHDVAEDAWITAAPPPGSLVFVFGTLLERRTGGLLRAGRYRCVSPVKANRTSASVFYNAGLDTSVLPPHGGAPKAAAGGPATVGDVYRGLVSQPAA